MAKQEADFLGYLDPVMLTYSKVLSTDKFKYKMCLGMLEKAVVLNIFQKKAYAKKQTKY